MVLSGLWVDTNGRFLGADGAVPLKVCPAGVTCGGSFLPIASGGKGMGAPPYAHGVKPYFGLYGIGQFDGQNSGHDFFGTAAVMCSGFGLLAFIAV